MKRDKIKGILWLIVIFGAAILYLYLTRNWDAHFTEAMTNGLPK